MKFIKEKEGNVFINIKVQPNSKKLGPLGLFGENLEFLKWGVNASPIDGEANKDLIANLAKYFSIPKSKISIEKGEKSREKVISMRDLGIVSILNKLKQPI